MHLKKHIGHDPKPHKFCVFHQEIFWGQSPRDISRAEGNEMKYAASKSPVDIEAFAELYKFTEP